MAKLRNILVDIWNNEQRPHSLNPLFIFLYLLSLPYGGIIRLRNLLYDRGMFAVKRLNRPVISVGNITVGGTGKTPMVVMLANFLSDAGFRPAILSRGYAAKNKKPVNIVSDGDQILQGPGEAGDEPFLIACSTNRVPVLTGPERHLTGQHAIERFGADVLIMDDGFQHRGLFRDLNIVLLDAGKPFGNGLLIPGGSLREPRNALKRADIVVLTRAKEGGGESELESELGREFRVPLFRSRHLPQMIVKVDGGYPYPPEEIAGKRVSAFSGIARPEFFKQAIESLGGRVVAFRSFPDHHDYTPEDMENIWRMSQNHQADIILTTEKDGVKLSGQALHDIFMLRIEIDIIPDRKKFEDLILSRLKS